MKSGKQTNQLTNFRGVETEFLANTMFGKILYWLIYFSINLWWYKSNYCKKILLQTFWTMVTISGNNFSTKRDFAFKFVLGGPIIIWNLITNAISYSVILDFHQYLAGYMIGSRRKPSYILRGKFMMCPLKNNVSESTKNTQT